MQALGAIASQLRGNASSLSVPVQLVGPARHPMFRKPVLDDAKRRMIVQLRWLAMQAKKRRDDRMRRTKAELDFETQKIKFSIDKYIARRRAVNLLHVLAADKYKARSPAPFLRWHATPTRLLLQIRRDPAPLGPADALVPPNQQHDQANDLETSIQALDAMRRLSQYDSGQYLIVEHGGLTARTAPHGHAQAALRPEDLPTSSRTALPSVPWSDAPSSRAPNPQPGRPRGHGALPAELRRAVARLHPLRCAALPSTRAGRCSRPSKPPTHLSTNPRLPPPPPRRQPRPLPRAPRPPPPPPGDQARAHRPPHHPRHLRVPAGRARPGRLLRRPLDARHGHGQARPGARHPRRRHPASRGACPGARSGTERVRLRRSLAALAGALAPPARRLRFALRASEISDRGSAIEFSRPPVEAPPLNKDKMRP